MRVFVAGASGAIGRPLVRRLLEAGHEVTGTSRSPHRAETLRETGATVVVCDALDRAAVRRAVEAARPEVIVNQLTSLPQEYDPRKLDYGPTNRIRREGGGNLIAAALEAGVGRFVTQSIAFLYAPEGDTVKDEEGRPWLEAPPPFREAVASMLEHERQVTGTEGIDGLVLRYGQFYGPGTYYGADGDIAQRVRTRRFPIVGRGEGVFSFIHVDDAADATVAACERGAPGIYNVTDDEPAPLHEWLPVYAEALGAKRPFRVPLFLARLAAGGFAAAMSSGLRGASNTKAKRELGWEPSYASWREGFRSGT